MLKDSWRENAWRPVSSAHIYHGDGYSKAQAVSSPMVLKKRPRKRDCLNVDWCQGSDRVLARATFSPATREPLSSMIVCGIGLDGSHKTEMMMLLRFSGSGVGQIIDQVVRLATVQCQYAVSSAIKSWHQDQVPVFTAACTSPHCTYLASI